MLYKRSLMVLFDFTFVCLVIPPMVTIEFETASVDVNESDGSVTVNLVRRTGTLSDNITVCIGITTVVDPAIIQCMCTSGIELHWAFIFLNYLLLIISWTNASPVTIHSCLFLPNFLV